MSIKHEAPLRDDAERALVIFFNQNPSPIPMGSLLQRLSEEGIGADGEIFSDLIHNFLKKKILARSLPEKQIYPGPLWGRPA